MGLHRQKRLRCCSEARAFLREDVLRAQRVAMTRIAHDPAGRGSGVQCSNQAVTRQRKPMRQFDEAGAAMCSEVSEQRHVPAATAQGNEIV